MMASDIDLGRRIRDMRVARGMTQAELAKQLDVSTTAVWNWEMNGAQPRPAMLNSVAAALGVSEAFLRTGQADAEAKPLPRKVPDIIYAARKEIAEYIGVEIDCVAIDWRVVG